MKVPPTLPPELQQALREIWHRIDRQSGVNSVDLHGRRFLNAGESVAPNDFITRAELERLLGTDEVSFIQTGGAAAGGGTVGPGTLSGTHAERLVTALVRGLGFFETDRTVTYIVNETAGVLVWNYVSGSMVGVDGAWPTDLISTDVGFLYDATDTLHQYRWSGTAWEFWGDLTGPGTAPATPNSPSPATTGTGVSLTPQLAWTASLATTYDVYFGTAASPPLVSSGQLDPTYTTGALSDSTRYYWKIVAINVHGTTTGPVWTFTTQAVLAAPAIPSSPSPADNATSVSVLPRLRWTATGATSHTVFFGNGLFNYTGATEQPNGGSAYPVFARAIWYGWYYSYSERYGYAENAPENIVHIEDLPSFEMAVAQNLKMVLEINYGGTRPGVAPVDWSDTTGHEDLIVALMAGGGTEAALVASAAAVAAARPAALASKPIYGYCDVFYPTASIANVDWLGLACYVLAAETAAQNKAKIEACLANGNWDAGQKFVLVGKSYTSNATLNNTDDDTLLQQSFPSEIALANVDVVAVLNFAWARPSGVIYDPAYPQYPDHEPAWRPVHEAIFDGIRYRDYGLANYTCVDEQPLLTPADRIGPAFYTCPDEMDEAWTVDCDAAVPPLQAASALGIAEWAPPRLAPNQSYFWWIRASNAAGVTDGPGWDFSTGETVNQAPGVPRSPYPTQGNTSVPNPPLVLTWIADRATSYDFYLGVTASPALTHAGWPTASMGLATGAGTRLYWKIVAHNAYGSTEGPVWYFTTAGALGPDDPTGPSPADGATNIAVNVVLSWNAPARADWYTIGFGTVFPPTPTLYPSAASPVTFNATNFTPPGGLLPSTRYYWYVQAHNTSGRATGLVWSFVTAGPAVPPTPTGTMPTDPTGHTIDIEGYNFRIATTRALWRWQGCTYFGMFHDYLDGGGSLPAAFWTWASSTGINIFRVLTMKCGEKKRRPPGFMWAPFYPTDYSDADLDNFLTYVEGQGYYVQVVALADCEAQSAGLIDPAWPGLPTFANKQAHLNRIAAVVASHPKTFLEEANEPEGNGVSQTDMLTLTCTAGVWVCKGSRGEPDLFHPVWHYGTEHSARSTFEYNGIDEWPRKAKNLIEYERIGGATATPGVNFPPVNIPFIGNEPMGMDESTGTIPQRSSDPQLHADYAAVAALLGSGSTIHSQCVGLQGELPASGSDVERCILAVAQVWADLPVNAKDGDYTAGHLSTCPLIEDLSTAMKYYGKINGNKAWMIAVGRTAAYVNQPRAPWRVVGTYGYNGNLVYLEK